MRGIYNLSLDASHELPYLLRSELSSIDKTKVFFTFFKISFKLFTVHRIKKLKSENFLGFRVFTFDYGALHFLFREIFVKNTYFFKDHKNKKLIIFDCGANMGMATLYFKWLYPNSIIHAFEADPQTFELLSKNISINKLKDVHLHNIAIQNKKGSIKFYIDKKNPGWLTMSTQRVRLPGKNVITVPCDKLSSFIHEEIDFLKMDIEGSESEAVKDLIESNKIDSIKKAVVEYHHDKEEVGKLSNFLDKMSKQNFTTEIQSDASGGGEAFQDILLRLQKK